MLAKKDIEGVVRNAFYKPNTRKGHYNGFFERDMEQEMKSFCYDIDNDGKLVIIRKEN